MAQPSAQQHQTETGKPAEEDHRQILRTAYYHQKQEAKQHHGRAGVLPYSHQLPPLRFRPAPPGTALDRQAAALHFTVCRPHGLSLRLLCGSAGRPAPPVVVDDLLLCQLCAVTDAPVSVHFPGVSPFQFVIYGRPMHFQLRGDFLNAASLVVKCLQLCAVFQRQMSLAQAARLLLFHVNR